MSKAHPHLEGDADCDIEGCARNGGVVRNRRGNRAQAARRRIRRVRGRAAHGADGCAAAGRRPHVSMDVTDDASMVAGVERIIAEQGRIDALVNNAGYGSYGAVEDVPIDEARRQFEVNIFGLARLAQLVTPHMRTQGSGRIINISTIGGKIYEPLGAWYHATKFAVEGLSDSLRIELRPFGIDVVIVEPGPIRTEWNTIARDNLRATSAGTAYADRAVAVTHVLEQADRPSRSSGPDVVARKIAKAASVRTRRRATRSDVRPGRSCAPVRYFPTGRWTRSSDGCSADLLRRLDPRERDLALEQVPPAPAGCARRHVPTRVVPRWAGRPRSSPAAARWPATRRCCSAACTRRSA